MAKLRVGGTGAGARGGGRVQALEQLGIRPQRSKRDGLWRPLDCPKLLLENDAGTHVLFRPSLSSKSREALIDALWSIYADLSEGGLAIALPPRNADEGMRFVRWDGRDFSPIDPNSVASEGASAPSASSQTLRDTFGILPNRLDLLSQQRTGRVADRGIRPGRTLRNTGYGLSQSLDEAEAALMVGVAVVEIPADPARGIPSLGISDYAGRKWHSTAGNSRYRGSQEDLLALVQEHWDQRAAAGNRPADDLDSVVIVPVPVEDFVCDTAFVDEHTPLHAEFGRRRRGEDGYAQLSVEGEPEPAQFAGVVLYSKVALCENDGERETGADWEVVAVDTSPLPRSSPNDAAPMRPLTIARNILEKPGGTKMPVDSALATMLAKSVVFYARRASIYVERQSDGPATRRTETPNFVPGPLSARAPATDQAPALRIDARAGPVPFRGSGEALLDRVRAHWSQRAPDGDRITLRLPADDFGCLSARLDERSELFPRLVAEEGQGPQLKVFARGEPEPARFVELSLVPDEDGLRVAEVRTSPVEGPEPPDPFALATTQLEQKSLSAEDAYALAEAVYHHALRAPLEL